MLDIRCYTLNITGTKFEMMAIRATTIIIENESCFINSESFDLSAKSFAEPGTSKVLSWMVSVMRVNERG